MSLLRTTAWHLLPVALVACGTTPDKATSTPATSPTSVDTAGTTEDPVVDDDCIDDAEFFATDAAPMLEAECGACHVVDGAAGSTAYVLQPGENDLNYAMLTHLVASVGPETVLAKPTGETSHGGGVRFTVLDTPFATLHELVARIEAPGACTHPGTPPITCTDRTVHPGAAPLRRLTDHQYQTLVADVFEITLPDGIFPATPLGEGFRTAATNNVVSASGAESVMLAAEHVSSALDLTTVLDCGADAEDCGRTWLLDRAEATWRRPLTDAEQAIVTRFLDAGLPAEEGVRMGVFVLLQAPGALYLDAHVTEQVRDGSTPDHDVHALDPHAVASRLSFFVTDAPPDADLQEAATVGALTTRAEVAAHAARLVAQPRTTSMVARFHQDWLHLHQLRDQLKDLDAYPQYDDAIVADMVAETDLYTTEVVWMGDATFDTLMFDTTSWVTPELAAIYGVTTDDTDWSRVSLPEDTRPGVLSRTAFLTAHSYAAASAPVRRGAWVLENLLCEDLVPPPGIDTTLPELGGEIETIRDKLAVHAADPACRSCHDRIDPIGFSFEHYDGIGAWRDAWETGHPVDATGSLEDPAGDFDGYAEMIALVASSPRARACYSRRWFEYAVGRPAGPGDACSLAQLAERFEASGGNIRSLLVDITLTDAFLYRTTAGLDPFDPAGGADASD